MTYSATDRSDLSGSSSLTLFPERRRRTPRVDALLACAAHPCRLTRPPARAAHEPLRDLHPPAGHDPAGHDRHPYLRRSWPIASCRSRSCPTSTSPRSRSRAELPGASPETMASAVATPLEKQFSTIAGVDQMTSSSAQGTTQITLQFALDRDIDAAAQDVQTAISLARRQLPAGHADTAVLPQGQPGGHADLLPGADLRHAAAVSRSTNTPRR